MSNNAVAPNPLKSLRLGRRKGAADVTGKRHHLRPRCRSPGEEMRRKMKTKAEGKAGESAGDDDAPFPRRCVPPQPPPEEERDARDGRAGKSGKHMNLRRKPRYRDQQRRDNTTRMAGQQAARATAGAERAFARCQGGAAFFNL